MPKHWASRRFSPCRKADRLLSLSSVQKSYGDNRVLIDIDVQFPESGYTVIVGQSGSGKTTLLRAIAGHVPIDSGCISLGHEEISELPPHHRPVASVFQQYALFPHLTIADNIGFGLEQQGIPADERRTRIREMLELVGLSGYDQRKPETLSGGQQQRVALARALAVRPRVVMLDEPLGALDLELRQTMRRELKRIQRQTGVLFLHVSHDREEALSLADHMVIMHQGQVAGAGSLADLQADPGNDVVAKVLGLENCVPHPDLPEKLLAFAPEHVELAEDGWAGSIRSVVQVGAYIERDIKLETGIEVRERSVARANSEHLRAGDRVAVSVADANMRILDRWSGHREAES